MITSACKKALSQAKPSPLNAGSAPNKFEFVDQYKNEFFPLDTITLNMFDFQENSKASEDIDHDAVHGDISLFPFESRDGLYPKLDLPLPRNVVDTASFKHEGDTTLSELDHSQSSSIEGTASYIHDDDICSLRKHDLSLINQKNDKASRGHDGDPINFLCDNLDFYAGGNEQGCLELPSPSKSSTSSDDSREKAISFHYEEMWSDRYKDLVAFVNENGHANVPNNYAKNQQLARWVKRQRRLYKQLQDGKQSALPIDRMIALESVGFVWDSHESCWREKFNALLEFRRKHGHCNVPLTCKENKLGTWVKCQRRQYKLYCAGNTSAMDHGRMKELEDAGFEWEIRRRGSNLKKIQTQRR